MKEHVTMQELPASEQPYEKFLAHGAEALSDAELLAIIIKTGTRDRNSTDLARQLLSNRQGNLLNLYDYTLEELLQIPGIGRVKAIQLLAVAELSKRISKTQRQRLMQMKDSDSIASYYMEQLRHRQTEILMIAFFDVKYNFLGDCAVSEGCVNSTYVSPREIFRQALKHNAVKLIAIHNHPSGDPTPSGDDFEITRIIRQCGSMIGIELADHIIIGDNRYYSFRGSGYFE